MFYTRCEGILLTEIYVEDINFYDSCGLDKTSNYTPCVVEGGNYRSLIFNTDHYEFGLSSNQNTAFVLNNFEVPTDCIIEYDVLQKESSSYATGIGFAHTTATNKASFNGGVFFGTSMSWYNYINQKWTETNYSNQKYINNKSILNEWIHITLEKHGYTITINAYDDKGNIFSDLTKVINTNLRDIPLELALFGFNSNHQIKNIKVKPL